MVGNTNLLQFAMLALFLFLRAARPTAWSAASAGFVGMFGACFKPLLAPAVLGAIVVDLLDRRFSRASLYLAGVAAGGAFSFASSVAYFSSMSCWFSWLRALSSLGEKPVWTGQGNASVVALLVQMGAPSLASPLFLLAMAGVVYALWSSRRLADPDSWPWRYRQVLAVSLPVSLFVALSPHAWIHYYVLCVPAMLATTTTVIVGVRPTSSSFASILAVAGSWVMLGPWYPAYYSLVPYEYGMPVLYLGSQVLATSVALSSLRRIASGVANEST